jgi:hypothetical protein
MNDNKDAFDLWWEWAEKPLDSPLTMPPLVRWQRHNCIVNLRFRAKFNGAVRGGP